MRQGIIASLVGLLLLSATAPVALASGAGGVSGDSPPAEAVSPSAGGAEYGSSLRALPGRPVVRALRLTRPSITSGPRPRIVVRITRPRAAGVRVHLAVAHRNGASKTFDLGRVPTSRSVSLALPAKLHLYRGVYTLRLIALGSAGERAASSPPVRLTVRAKPKPVPHVAPEQQGPTSPTPVPPIFGGKTTPGVFPVQGPFDFGGADARFGAGRTGHKHEGQDILAAEGTPVVAPVAGEVLFNDYQRSAAGRYIVLHADDGRDMFFAHCQAGSANVKHKQCKSYTRCCPAGRSSGCRPSLWSRDALEQCRIYKGF